MSQTNKLGLGKAGDGIHKGINIRTGNSFAILGDQQQDDEVTKRRTMSGDKSQTGKGYEMALENGQDGGDRHPNG